MYQVVKRDGRVVEFSIEKISAAITKAFESLEETEREISVLDFLGLDPEDYEQVHDELEERKRELKKHCKKLIISLNSILRMTWLKRNAGAGRSNTSAVSDKMLLTIPTPPTAMAANRSLRQRGMAYGAMA